MDESKPFGISMRGWLSLILVMTVCIMAYQGKLVIEPLYTLVSLAVGFYFGQKQTSQTKEIKANV